MERAQAPGPWAQRFRLGVSEGVGLGNLYFSLGVAARCGDLPSQTYFRDEGTAVQGSEVICQRSSAPWGSVVSNPGYTSESLPGPLLSPSESRFLEEEARAMAAPGALTMLVRGQN